MSANGSQGEVYAKFVADELGFERQRRERLDARGSALLATSGALAALATALGLVDPRGLATQPSAVRLTYSLAALILLSSAITAFTSAWLHGYKVFKAGSLVTFLESSWADPTVVARGRVARINAETFLTLREGNNAKARKLLIAHVLQVIGSAGFLAVAVWSVANFVTA